MSSGAHLHSAGSNGIVSDLPAIMHTRCSSHCKRQRQCKSVSIAQALQLTTWDSQKHSDTARSSSIDCALAFQRQVLRQPLSPHPDLSFAAWLAGNEIDITMVNLDDILPQATIMVVTVTGSTTSGQSCCVG